MNEYRKRIIDDELSLRLEAFEAVQSGCSNRWDKKADWFQKQKLSIQDSQSQ